MRYQESWKDEDWDKISGKNQENLAATVHRALSVGINHIETARGYGTSERQLGRVLPSLPREKLIIQTKVGPAPAAEYLKTFDRSMELLGIEHVDLLAIHGVNNDELLDQTLAPGGALEAARRIQRDGRARFIGFSTHASCATITRALATSEFDYVNLHWYWINQESSSSALTTKVENSTSPLPSSLTSAGRSHRWHSTISSAFRTRRFIPSVSELQNPATSMRISKHSHNSWMHNRSSPELSPA
jgi:predicted aldo/keto reductase-like oxidoreductase